MGTRDCNYCVDTQFPCIAGRNEKQLFFCCTFRVTSLSNDSFLVSNEQRPENVMNMEMLSLEWNSICNGPDVTYYGSPVQGIKGRQSSIIMVGDCFRVSVCPSITTSPAAADWHIGMIYITPPSDGHAQPMDSGRPPWAAGELLMCEAQSWNDCL